MPTARRTLALTVLACASCRFQSQGAETGGADWGPAADSDSGSESSSGDPLDGSSGAMTIADTSDPVDDDESTSAADEGVEPEDPCPRLRVDVTAGNVLNVRPDASTAGEPVGQLPNHAIVDRLASVDGEWIGDSDDWYQIASADAGVMGFVFSRYAVCTTDEPPELLQPDGYWLPLECGTTATISQGNDGEYSHQDNAFYAFDFAVPLETPLVAMADGIVIHRYTETVPGDPCYAGGDDSCYPYANLVVLLHGDGFASIYKHLSEVLVSPGEFVPRGTIVGLSGSTGFSTGPHAHVMRQEECGQPNCQSIPLEFAEIGVPVTDQEVTSNNCP